MVKVPVNDYRLFEEKSEYNLWTMTYTLQEIQTISPLTTQFAIDGKPNLGFITVNVLEEEYLLWLVELTVAPAMENKGFGAHLLVAGMQVGLARGLSTVIGTFEPDRDARRVADWYRKRGFSIRGKDMRGDIQTVHDSCLATMGEYNILVPLKNTLVEEYFP